VRAVVALVAATVFLAGSGRLLAQVNQTRYAPGTIQALIDSNEADIRREANDSVPNWIVSGNSFPRRTTVVFTGERRPLDPLRQQLLLRWGWGIRHDSTIARRFTTEYLFREGGRDHWLAVQSVLEPDIARELAAGDTVTLFVAWFGAHFRDGTMTWLFSVNDFASGR
jgi:hypothetical protein